MRTAMLVLAFWSVQSAVAQMTTHPAPLREGGVCDDGNPCTIDALGPGGACTHTAGDVTPPVITCPADITVFVAAPLTPEFTGFATAVDACDGPVPASRITFQYLTSPPCPLPRIRRWTAVDSSGNSAVCYQTITLVHPHTCCEARTGPVPGCSDPDIEACVCAISNFCCEEKWDVLCVGLVAQCGYACTRCTDQCNNFPAPHDCCYTHAQGCSNDDIETAVCAVSDFCCTQRWDATCVSLARQMGFCPAGDCSVLGLHPNGIPDECEANCDHDSRADTCEFNPPTCSTGACCIGLECQNVVQEACSLRHGAYAGDGTTCAAGTCNDCNKNAFVDSAEIQAGTVPDADGNGVIDTCEAGACCRGTTCAEGVAAACVPFVCNVADHLPASFLGCYGDEDGNGTVTSGDRGFICANFGSNDPVMMCLYDEDGNGVVNPGDRGFVAANIDLCMPLPDWQNGSGLNHGVPDTRFAAQAFKGIGTSCVTTSCP